MPRPLIRVVVGALIGALAGGGVLAAAFASGARVVIPLNTRNPRVLAGFHGAEHGNDRWFAWTGPKASVTLAGLDRRVPWRCAVSLRGARAPGIVQPTVVMSVDGEARTTVTATNTFARVPVDVDPRPAADGVVLAIASQPTFVPGPGDRRELGVQVDGIECLPTAGGAWPPRSGLLAAAVAAALFAAAFTALGAPLSVAVPAVLGLAVLQTLCLISGPALYTGYVDRVAWLAIWPCLLMATVAGAARWRQRSLDPAARVALAVAGSAAFLILLALLHPSKAVVDAQFHAHRLAWVEQGRYFFTQPMPDGVTFPYAIALYVVTLPWVAVTRDYITLLRGVVVAAHLLAGLLLFVTIRRDWRDEQSAIMTLLLFVLVPQWFVVVGNANLTAAFGQSVATMALMCATIPQLQLRNPARLGALFVAAAVAFLSHVGTFPALAAALVVLAVLCGVSPSPGERRAGWTIAIVTAAAAIFAVAIYYSRFDEVYRSIDRVLGRAPAVQATAPPPVIAPMRGLFPRGGPTPSTLRRAATAADVARQAIGWPIVMLALVGGRQLVAGRRRDRLTLALTASLVSGLLFLAFGVLAPVEDAFYRYNVEFLGRVIFVTWPAIVALAGLGATRLWHAGPAPRALAVALTAWAFALAGSNWLSWFR